jgi:hypothetical protein
MTFTVALWQVLLLLAIVLAVAPAFRRQRGDYDFGGAFWIVACWPAAFILGVWSIIELWSAS